jgi:glucosamine--fructose-6-phosphate aminotransferase (isomerizing)
MCGIIALLSKKNCIQLILNGLKQLQNRGYDSSGICTLNKTFSMIKYASENNFSAIEKLENNLDKIKDSYIGIGHTRWATHGAKTDINSHPHISYNNKISLVHNGIIENYAELKKELIEKGIEFKSQTDTEVIVNLLAYEYDENNDFLKSLEIIISKLEGTWGLTILNKDEPDKLYCIRHGSPLLVSQNNDFVMIASEQSGFCGLVNNYIVLDSNDICIITKENDIISINTNNKYELKDTIKGDFQLTPEPYIHWTIKEIEEQVESSMRAISLGGRLLDNDKVKMGGLEENKEILIRIDNIIILGCGTSYHAGLLGISYMKDLCDFNSTQIFDGAEFTEKDIPKIGNTALILMSQSGETKDLHRCIKIGKEKNLFLIGVINVVDSMIAREVHCGCYLNAGREVAVASTKAFTSQSIILSMIAVWFSQIHNSNNYKRQTYIKCLRQLPMDLKQAIQISKKYKELYISMLNKSGLFVLGKGRSEAIAREGALKIKEITYIHAEGYSGSSLKHGPFALLDENMPVIMVTPNDEHIIKMNNAYEEIKSRYAPILFITNDNNCNKENSIILPYNEIYGDLLSIIPLQIISYYLSVHRDINPDFPKNLAKTVVVE